MNTQDLMELETLFGITLPTDYKALLLDYPAELPSVVKGYALVDHPELIKDQNENVRAGPLWGVKWPLNYFVVGDDGSGNLFYLDTTKNPSPVFVFDHEDRAFREEAPSIAKWVPQLIAIYAA
jgi:hypothetical protein